MHREEHELVGLGFEAITHPDDCARSVIAVSTLRSEAQPFMIRKRYMRADGSAVWANVQASRFRDVGDGAGRIIGTIQLVDAGDLRHGPERLWQAARQQDDVTQRRRQELGDRIFADYGWLILLQIYLAEVEARSASAVVISRLAFIQLPTVMNWLETLEQQGLVERGLYPECMFQLTKRGHRSVEYLLDRSYDL